MPTYVVSLRPGLLSDAQRDETARAITRIHHEATGAPQYFVQVVINEAASAVRYLGGAPANDQIWIRADIRAGRTVAQRTALMQAMVKAVSAIAGVDDTKVWIYLCNIDATDMIEYGHVLPQPGGEQAWFEALPQPLRHHLAALGATPDASKL